MAITKLKPLHIGKGCTAYKTRRYILDYGMNLEKTDGGRLVTAYSCDAKTAAAEWTLSKRQYKANTGRDQGKDADVIVYHTMQSFAPVKPRQRKPTPSAVSRPGSFQKATMTSLSAPI